MQPEEISRGIERSGKEMGRNIGFDFIFVLEMRVCYGKCVKTVHLPIFTEMYSFTMFTHLLLNTVYGSICCDKIKVMKNNFIIILNY